MRTHSWILYRRVTEESEDRFVIEYRDETRPLLVSDLCGYRHAEARRQSFLLEGVRILPADVMAAIRSAMTSK